MRPAARKCNSHVQVLITSIHSWSRWVLSLTCWPTLAFSLVVMASEAISCSLMRTLSTCAGQWGEGMANGLNQQPSGLNGRDIPMHVTGRGVLLTLTCSPWATACMKPLLEALCKAGAQLSIKSGTLERCQGVST